MRVVAGTARGLRLEAPEGNEVRPTTDRVREATFNALTSLGAIDDARVLDLFAGSGALGIEALSRGARSCMFCDTSPAALGSVRANLDRTGLAGSAAVRRVDALTHLASAAGRYDLVLADPPYSFADWPALLDAVDAPIAVLESGEEPAVGERFTMLRQRRYGTTVVTIVQQNPDEM